MKVRQTLSTSSHFLFTKEYSLFCTNLTKNDFLGVQFGSISPIVEKSIPCIVIKVKKSPRS